MTTLEKKAKPTAGASGAQAVIAQGLFGWKTGAANSDEPGVISTCETGNGKAKCA